MLNKHILLFGEGKLNYVKQTYFGEGKLNYVKQTYFNIS